ncbi:hypothetical protein F0919_09220 [Taibaiella lutea]|uniref:Uncharacterized protein n=1 Tax=Taibaiella lutea TaxID=2608001 RepID=A0A5M6CHT2_9BACT|nr:hypothetical protein [Taibaiella lutea]KAA5534778.1 hypothetical protein F0919_09220 [Taibaiella lutea]
MTYYTATIYNSSGHKITILPFIYGIVNSTDTIKLNEGDSFLLAEGIFDGDVLNPGFVSNRFNGPVDSTLVLFDNQYKMMHYTYVPDSLKGNYYLYDNPRNLWNSTISYEFTRIKDKNDNYTNVHKYIFTEQDYLDARE